MIQRSVDRLRQSAKEFHAVAALCRCVMYVRPFKYKNHPELGLPMKRGNWECHRWCARWEVHQGSQRNLVLEDVVHFLTETTCTPQVMSHVRHHVLHVLSTRRPWDVDRTSTIRFLSQNCIAGTAIHPHRRYALFVPRSRDNNGYITLRRSDQGRERRTCENLHRSGAIGCSVENDIWVGQSATVRHVGLHGGVVLGEQVM